LAAAAQEKVVDDDLLMRQICAADQAALRSFYDRYSGLVYTQALRILRDPMSAEDCLIDVFWELWARSQHYDRSRGSPLTYLMTLARSRAIDRRRAALRHATVQIDRPDEPAPAQEDPSAVSPLDDCVSRELSDRVRAALTRLDPAQRQAVELNFFDCLSHSEIAERLGKPLGTVKTNIRQGLIRLRDCLRME